MKSHLRTPLLVPTSSHRVNYIPSLNKPARKNYVAMRKACPEYRFHEVPYDHSLVTWYMQLWESQGYRWIFGPEYFQKLSQEGHLRLFLGEDEWYPAALLPMEQFGNFMYAQPVLYNKAEEPEAARFMWFEMLLWAHDEIGLDWVDLGGGFHGSWRNFLHNRQDPAFKYKWQYVPRAIKEKPDDQPEYFAQRCTCGYKQLVLKPEFCCGCASRL